jgi:uncharacterized Zn finger protein (UPF0148 family)
MKKYNIEEKADVVILTICPNCGWFWVKEKDDEVVCKNCYENLKNQYIEKYGKENFQESKFLDWVKQNLIIPIPQNKVVKSDSGLLRVRDMCWGCGHTQSVIFYKDRKYWQCCKDGSKNYCLNLMKIINLNFNSLLTKPIKLQRTTRFYKTQKGKIRVIEQNLNVLCETNNKIDLTKIKRGLRKWL